MPIARLLIILWYCMGANINPGIEQNIVAKMTPFGPIPK